MQPAAIQSARSDLLRGLAQGEVRLAFQPQIEIATGSITGFEAVARWDHPEFGLLTPGLFLGLAAREGLSGLLTRTLLAQAAAQVLRWREAGWPVMVALNLGPSDLVDPTFPADAVAAVREAAARADWLVLEAGEEALAAAGDAGFNTLELLRLAGFQVALDAKGPPAIALDGRGRALFCQLKCGGTTMLRVARRLQALDASPFARRIGAARAAGLSVVAVGAETEGAMVLFRSFGFDLVQGNAFSPPVAAMDAQLLLQGFPVRATPPRPQPYVPTPAVSAPAAPATPAPRSLRLSGVEIVEPEPPDHRDQPGERASDTLSYWG